MPLFAPTNDTTTTVLGQVENATTSHVDHLGLARHTIHRRTRRWMVSTTAAVRQVPLANPLPLQVCGDAGEQQAERLARASVQPTPAVTLLVHDRRPRTPVAIGSPVRRAAGAKWTVVRMRVAEVSILPTGHRVDLPPYRVG